MSNIKVFIVDDEDIVREGLKDYVPWYEYGMEVVGDAENGKQAYEFLSCNSVDLIISDIYMPHMDGLELIEKLKEINKSPVVILISGHSDFEYARRAIKSKIVFEYILKPINFEELDKVISAAKKKILDFAGNDFPVLSSEEWRKFANDEKNDRIAKQAEIISLIKFSEIDEALEIFDNTWKYMKRNSYTRTMVSRYCIELIMGLTELVMEQRNSREVLLEDPIPEINSKENEEEIKHYTEKIMKTSSDIMARKENKDLSPIVNLALDYINENYSSREQSLNSLADKLNVSPNYLCLKFKEETGINYTKYLNGLRVKHAKELLKDVRLKVYMVSEKVGFEDTRYFSRIFRTYTGYTPTEYQKKEAVRRD